MSAAERGAGPGVLGADQLHSSVPVTKQAARGGRGGGQTYHNKESFDHSFKMYQETKVEEIRDIHLFCENHNV